MAKKAEAVDINNFGFENVVEEFGNNQNEETKQNKFINSGESQAFPFEGEAIESNNDEISNEPANIFDMPVMPETTKDIKLEEPSVVEISEPEKDLPISLKNSLDQNKETTDSTSDISFDIPEVQQPLQSQSEEFVQLEKPEEPENDLKDEVSSDLTDSSTELDDLDSIIDELSNEIVGANNIASEIKEKKDALKRMEAKLIEQKEAIEKEKESLQKMVIEENEKMELKRVECDEYIKMQKQHMEEAEAQFKATVQTKEKDFADLQKQLEEMQQKMEQERMSFAVEKASAEEKVRTERENLQKENQDLKEKSNKLKKLLEQFTSVSKQITE